MKQSSDPAPVRVEWRAVLAALSHEGRPISPRDRLRVERLRRSRAVWTNRALRASLAALIGHERSRWEGIRARLAVLLDVKEGGEARPVVFVEPAALTAARRRRRWRAFRFIPLLLLVAVSVVLRDVHEIVVAPPPPEDDRPPPIVKPVEPGQRYEAIPVPPSESQPLKKVRVLRPMERADWWIVAGGGLLFLLATRIAVAPRVSERRRREEEKARRAARLAEATANRRRIEAEVQP